MFFFFKQKTAYEMRISDWSSDVCSSDLVQVATRSLPQLACRATGLTGPTAARFSTHHGLIARVGMRCGHRADIVAQFSKLFFSLDDPGLGIHIGAADDVSNLRRQQPAQRPPTIDQFKTHQQTSKT